MQTSKHFLPLFCLIGSLSSPCIEASEDWQPTLTARYAFYESDLWENGVEADFRVTVWQGLFLGASWQRAKGSYAWGLNPALTRSYDTKATLLGGEMGYRWRTERFEFDLGFEAGQARTTIDALLLEPDDGQTPVEYTDRSAYLRPFIGVSVVWEAVVISLELSHLMMDDQRGGMFGNPALTSGEKLDADGTALSAGLGWRF